MARGAFGGAGVLVAASILAGAFALGGCFYPAYEVITDGAAGAGFGGAGGSGSGGGGEEPDSCLPVGSETILACNQANPSAIAVTPEFVFWTNEDSGEIVQMIKLTGDIDPVIVAQKQPCGLAIGSGFLYWRTHSGELWRADVHKPLAKSQIDSDLGDSCALSANASGVFYFKVNASGPSQLMRYTVMDTKQEIAPVTSPVGVAATGNAVYWTDKSTNELYAKLLVAPGTQTKWSMTAPCGLASSDQFVVATAGNPSVSMYGNLMKTKEFDSPGAPCAAAVQGFTGVAWMIPSTGEVVAGGAGGTPSVKAKGPAPGCAVAIDGSTLYWTSCAPTLKNGRVMSFTVNNFGP